MTKAKHLPKIVFVITRSDIGGAQNHVLSLIKEFHKRYEIVLVAGSDGFLTRSVSALGLKVIILSEIDSYNPIIVTWKLKAILAKESPDLVHTHSSLASFYGRAAAKFCGLKVLHTVHGWHFASELNPIKWLIKVGLERCFRSLTDYWIAVSEFDRQLGNRFSLFKPGKMKVIVNGIKTVPVERGFEASSEPDVPLEVVFVGRSTYQKNCAAALKVMEQTQQNVNLTMFASGGQISILEDEYARSSQKHRIKLILNEPNAALEMNRFSVMLCTSRYEGMPLGVIEAMRSGLAIISTDVCGMGELVADGESGYLFKQSNIKGMAKQLDLFANDRRGLVLMGKASRLRYEHSFTLDKMLNSTEAVYQKLLD
jgi:glycosyltransferase involved in cell wall biosynthesis